MCTFLHSYQHLVRAWVLLVLHFNGQQMTFRLLYSYKDRTINIYVNAHVYFFSFKLSINVFPIFFRGAWISFLCWSIRVLYILKCYSFVVSDISSCFSFLKALSECTGRHFYYLEFISPPVFKFSYTLDFFLSLILFPAFP